MSGVQASFILTDELLDRTISVFEKWIDLRISTIRCVGEVADELDKLHKELSVTRVTKAAFIAAGGAAAAGAVWTGGISLYLAALAAATLGSFSAAIEEVIKLVKKKTRVVDVQRRIDADRANLAGLLSLLPEGIVLPGNGQKIEVSSIVDEMCFLYILGSNMYEWANMSQSVDTFIREYKACSLTLEDATRSHSTEARYIAPFTVIQQTIKIEKGDLSDAAKAIRETCSALRAEREIVCQLHEKLKERWRSQREMSVRERRMKRENSIYMCSVTVFWLSFIYSLINCFSSCS